MKVAVALTLLAISLSSQVQAATIVLDLLGKAGAGLLPGNENITVNGTPGRGGELGTGILFDDTTLVLTLNLGWGAGNGFANLTGNATMGHIHGPTTSGGTASFTQNAGVRIGLDDKPGWNPSATSGGFNGSVTLTSAQATELLAGRFYVNVHTSTNSGGEIRGNIVVPEPATAMLAALGAGALLGRRRR